MYSCSIQTVVRDGVPPIQVYDYEKIVDLKTRNIESYKGIYNQLNVSVTKIDTQMSEAVLARSAQIYEWDKTNYQNEKIKSEKDLATKSEYFMSFYTPERAHNNLTSLKPLWRIYLDVAGQRYEGRVVKVKTPLATLQVLYPYHNRFSSAYTVEFPIPTTQIENQPQLMTITGPSATVKLNF